MRVEDEFLGRALVEILIAFGRLIERDYGRVDEVFVAGFDVFLCSQPHAAPQQAQ